MTSRERMLVAMRNKQPDMVPVAPDISNMIPARLTGKPFWDIYLYDNPPLWKAYIDAVRYFGFDGWLPLYQGLGRGEWLDENVVIVERTEERLVTRRFEVHNGRKEWSDCVTVYPVGDPPTHLLAEKIGLQAPPHTYEPIEGAAHPFNPEEVLPLAKQQMKDDGVVGLSIGIPMLGSVEAVYSYYDDPESWHRKAREYEEKLADETKRICELNPDFILTGGSGTLVFQTVDIFRELGLPSLKIITSVAREMGVPTQVHSCGPERALVEICANETDLDSINPLEPPPMGDCDLAELKRKFGKKISLMGNLHTTEVMLHGTPESVAAASKWCIDAAAEGGGFILSTGDQCGRDTPEENILAMIETARTHGRY